MPSSPLPADDPQGRSVPVVPAHPKPPRQARQFLPLVLLLTTLVCALAGGSLLLARADASPPPVPVTALVQDVPQYLPAGYDSQAQFEAWNGYTCGPATLTAILHA